MKRRKKEMELFPEIAHYKKRRFLTALALCGRVAHAARLLRMKDDRIHYYWMKDDSEYAKAVEIAKQIAAQKVEDKLYELGVDGFDKPVIHEGEITDTYKEHSVTALIFLAKGNMPDKYRERAEVEHKGKITSTVVVETVDPFGLSRNKD